MQGMLTVPEQQSPASRESIRQWREKDPEVTAKEMSIALGISSQRVAQHLVALGLPTRTRKSYPIGPRLIDYDMSKRKPPAPRIITGGTLVASNSTATGTVSELLVAADLTARGYTVYLPILRHSAHCDLIALRQGAEDNPITIEVRSGRRRTVDGTISYTKNVESLATHHAVVVTGEPVIYHPDLPPVKNIHGYHTHRVNGTLEELEP